jgi:DNA/RNA-binding domain of Phe-tRNA-synthetase-like protein
VFVEENKVLTRRWIWRQANHTLTLPHTTAVEFNLDGLPPLGETGIAAAAGDVRDLVGRFCGGTFRFEVLSRGNPQISLGGDS